MLYFDGIDVSEGIVVNKRRESEECEYLPLLVFLKSRF